MGKKDAMFWFFSERNARQVDENVKDPGNGELVSCKREASQAAEVVSLLGECSVGCMWTVDICRSYWAFKHKLIVYCYFIFNVLLSFSQASTALETGALFLSLSKSKPCTWEGLPLSHVSCYLTIFKWWLIRVPCLQLIYNGQHKTPVLLKFYIYHKFIANERKVSAAKKNKRETERKLSNKNIKRVHLVKFFCQKKVIFFIILIKIIYSTSPQKF